MSCESQTHVDAYGGRKLFETREQQEKHAHESTQVESGDDDPICATKEGGASGQSKRGYINYCVSSLYNPLVRGRELHLPKYPNTISNTHYARACRWGRYSDPNLQTLTLRPVPHIPFSILLDSETIFCFCSSPRKHMPRPMCPSQQDRRIYIHKYISIYIHLYINVYIL